MKKLIINADDFGLNASVNRAIIECHQTGIVTSTTLMVNCPGTKEAVELAKENPTLGVGLHFDLTLGFPIANKKSTLTDTTGRFLSRFALEKATFLHRIDPDDVEEELALQWDMFLSLGLTPTHIDGHQHVQVLPGIAPVLTAFAKSKQVPLRVPQESFMPLQVLSLRALQPKNLVRLLRKAVLGQYCRQMRSSTTHAGVLTNDHFFSVLGYWPPLTIITPADYARIFHRLPEGLSELMVHPSYPQTDAQYITSIQKVSKQELDIVRNDALKKTLKECNIQLVNYKDIL